MARKEKPAIAPWLFRGEPFTQDDAEYSKAFGFVYLITNLTSGRMYVGRKYFTSKKGKRRVPSDWESYCGSCQELKDDIESQGHSNFRREIIEIYPTRGQVNYGEVAEQVKRDVLTAKTAQGERLYYNGNIMSRWFVSTGGWNHTEELKKRHSELVTGKVRTPEMRARYSAAKKGIPKSQEHKKKLSAVNLGKKQTESTKAKRVATMKTLKWWTDGVRCQRSIECPDGWRAGRIINKNKS